MIFVALGSQVSESGLRPAHSRREDVSRNPRCWSFLRNQLDEALRRAPDRLWIYTLCYADTVTSRQEWSRHLV